MNIVVQTAIKEQLESSEQFPVDFDVYWEWLGFSRKDNAKRSFESSGFIADIDFRVSLISEENPKVGRPLEKIKLTIDCAKSFAMMTKTEKGKEVRLYYLECERIAKSVPVVSVSTPIPTPRLLSPVERIEAVDKLKSSLDYFGIDISNPRFNQELKDFVGDVLGIGVKALSESKETWVGVAERAEQLGYSISLVTKNRSSLGKFVKSFGIDSKQENRLCNGTQRPINLYKVSDELDKSIKEFMDAKVLAS